MRLRSQFLGTVALMSLVFGFVPSSVVRATTEASNVVTINAGDLIRGTSFSAVYYMGEDGFRYVFPNDKTYFTWYENFDDVKMISDAKLATIQMGGNVTYRPTVKMVKINSDPKTYFVAPGGVLRWVFDETIAGVLYGGDWNTDIEDVPDGFFGNYRVGEDITADNIEDFAAVILRNIYGGSMPTDDEFFSSTISEDKSLSDYTEIVIKNNEFTRTDLADSNTITIDAGQTVLWRNDDSVNHTATADDNSWGTGTIKPDGWFVRRFDEPGTYTYFCSYHPEMTGTVIVEEVLTM